MSLSLSLSRLSRLLAGCASSLSSCFSPPQMHVVLLYAATKGHAEHLHPNVTRTRYIYLSLFLSKEPEAIVYDGHPPPFLSLSLSLCPCPFGSSSPCTEEGVLHRLAAGRQPSIKLMYELEETPRFFQLFAPLQENHAPPQGRLVPLSSTLASTFWTLPESRTRCVGSFPLDTRRMQRGGGRVIFPANFVSSRARLCVFPWPRKG